MPYNKISGYQGSKNMTADYRPNSAYGLSISNSMPKPRPSKSGAWKAWLLAIISMLIVSGTAVWLASEPEKKTQLRQQAANIVNDIFIGTPFAGIGAILLETPPPPPPQVVSPPTDSGTLAGRNVTGTIAAPIYTETNEILAETSQNNANITDSGIARTIESGIAKILGQDRGQANQPPVFSQNYVQPATEDSKVSPSYLAGIAQWLADHYKPGSKGGNLVINVQGLNHVCGVKLASQTQGGRASLLRYAFQPSMIQGLYDLYINRFMEDLNRAAQKRGLDPQQNRQFHMALAGKSMLIARALEGIMQVPELGKQLAKIDALAQKAVDINAQLASAVFELDELRQSKAGNQQISATQLRVDGITARYRRAMDEHSNAQRALIAEIRKYSGQSLDDDSLLFMSAWTERRIVSDSQARTSIKKCIEALRDLARRCEQAGNS